MDYQLKFDEEGDFYFTQEIRDSSSDEADDNAIKIQAVLLFIGRYYAKMGDLFLHNIINNSSIICNIRVAFQAFCTYMR